VVGLAIAGGLAVLFAVLFAVGERFFPPAPADPGSEHDGEWKRRAEIRAYLDAIDEPYTEDYPLDSEPVAFYLPERDVAITFDGQAYFRIEREGLHAVLVEHEMPGGHLGARLPFETPETRFDRRRSEEADARERRQRWERRRRSAGGGTSRAATGKSERQRVASAFDRLGVPRDADEDEIRAAYREQVKEVHPDHGGEEEAFRELQEAYTAAREATN
jgi:hypothetical protein